MSNINAYIIGAIWSIQTLCTCIISTLGQYIYAHYLDTYPIPPNSTTNFTTLSTSLSLNFLQKFNDETKKCTDSEDIFPNSDAQQWAQQRSADLFFWTNLCNSCPMIVMTYILGLYTPKLGQSFVLVLTMLGTLLQFGVWLAIIYYHLPEYGWYIAAIINGLSGSSTVLIFVLTLIITDNTEESDLSSRFVRLGAIQTALSAVGTFAIGYYIEWRGFTDLYWIGFGLELFSIFIILIAFKSMNTNTNERTPLLSSVNTDEFKEFSSSNNNKCENFFQVCTVLNPKRRSSKKSASLFLTLFSNIFYQLACSAFAPFLWFLLNAPFCWTSREIGNYSALAAISYAVLSVLGMHALTSAGANDAIICLISHLSFFASSMWLAFARNSWELYAGLIVSAFSGYQGSLTNSMLIKCLEPYERTNAFTLVTELNTIIYSFGTTFFNWIYSRTVVQYRNFTLLLCAGICIIPVILNLTLFLVTRKMLVEDSSLITEIDIEPAPLRLPNSVPPHAGDAACMIIPSRSLTSSLRTPVNDRSRANSMDYDILDDRRNSSTNDLITF